MFDTPNTQPQPEEVIRARWCGAPAGALLAMVWSESQRALDEALDEIDQLHAAIWKAYGILGFDTDGDDHYAGTLPIDEFLIQFCTEHRKDYDDAINEAIG